VMLAPGTMTRAAASTLATSSVHRRQLPRSDPGRDDVAEASGDPRLVSMRRGTLLHVDDDADCPPTHCGGLNCSKKRTFVPTRRSCQEQRGKPVAEQSSGRDGERCRKHAICCQDVLNLIARCGLRPSRRDRPRASSYSVAHCSVEILQELRRVCVVAVRISPNCPELNAACGLAWLPASFLCPVAQPPTVVRFGEPGARIQNLRECVDRWSDRYITRSPIV
jgi:hypothetical protein